MITSKDFEQFEMLAFIDHRQPDRVEGRPGNATIVCPLASMFGEGAEEDQVGARRRSTTAFRLQRVDEG